MSNSNQIAVRTFDRRNVFLEKEIGKGRFGKVYLASIADANLPPVAIKVISADYTTEESLKKGRDSAYDELLKAAVLDHENVVKLYGMIVQEQDFPWLVFEYMNDGTLQEFVIRNEPVKEKILINICSQVSCGMAFLHNSGFVHKDLAARNILLKGNVAKIADLGLSSFLTSNATFEDDGVYTLNGKVFPFRHAAVECIVEQIFTFGSDVWSFGILMYEIFSGGMTPYGKENKEPEVRRFIAEGITPLHLAEPKCSPKILSLMRFILNPTLKERPTFQKLVEIFQQLISGTNSAEGAASQTYAYPAVPSFHNLQHSKSGSANNIIISNSPVTAATFHPAPQDHAHGFNDPFLGVPVHYSSSRSSSSPDLLDPVLFKGIRATLNGKQSQRQHDKRGSNERTLLGNFYEDNSRRHSNGNVGFPLHEHHSSSSNMKKFQSAEITGFDEQYEQQRRTSITNDNDNPLLKGFVQNRFNKKTHSSVHNV